MSFKTRIELSTREAKNTHTTKQGRPLGAPAETPDGRVFAWAFSAEALTTGIPVTSLARGGLATAGQANINTTASDTGDISSTFGSITLSSTWSTWGAILDEYADGYLFIQESTHSNARGQMVRVKSNTEGTTSTTDSPFFTTITFADDDYLKAGADTGAEVEVVHNEYFDVIENDGSTSFPIVGVPITEVGDNEYFWCQTWGPCGVQIQGTAVYGERLSTSTDSLQGFAPYAKGNSTGMTDLSYESAVKGDFGWLLGSEPGDGDMGLVFLTIRP